MNTITTYRVTKHDEMYVPVYDWTNHDLDEKVQEQMINLAKLPFAKKHIALMPDAHAGFGMPIGGVLFTDNVVVPYAIGVDIGCGVQIARTNLVWGVNFDKEKLKNVLHQIQRDIPTGFSSNQKPVYEEAALWAKLEAKGIETKKVVPDNLVGWVRKVLNSVGSLGGGNHFLEVQRDDNNQVYFMLHSGSRNLGQQICKFYWAKALELNTLWHSELPHKELAYLPQGTVEFDDYMYAMNVGLAWAEINRETMMDKVEYAFKKHASVHAFDVLVDVHHNFAAVENHFGQNGIVHRKGAVRARAGEMVLIPGSMGTGSYIAEGLGNRDSFMTCQHGAGRAVGRKEMHRQMDPAELKQEMKELDIELFSAAKDGNEVEEAARAYKDIESVMANSADLIKPLTKLYPLGVVKG